MTIELGSVIAGLAALFVAVSTLLGKKLNHIDRQVNGGEGTSLHERLDIIEARLDLINEKVDKLSEGEE